jgi:hypothetical protein
MEEKEFLKEHPSLGEYHLQYTEYSNDERQITLTDVHKTQLDKQKVLEAINKRKLFPRKEVESLIKELGL